MQQVADLHTAAMDLADQADRARRRGQRERAVELALRAFELEAAAARCVQDDVSAEPTRSVLHRSAASLAVMCGRAGDAERLIAVALAGNPPAEIAQELRDFARDLAAAAPSDSGHPGVAR